MKISNIDSFIEEFRNGRNIWSRAEIELAVREISRLRKENNKLKVRIAACENDLVLLEVSEMLKKTQARVQELEVQLKSKEIVINSKQQTINEVVKKLIGLRAITLDDKLRSNNGD